MSKKLRILSGLAVLHAIVVVLGASNIRVPDKGIAGELVTWYGALTGAERGFGFFAPSVNTQARAVFEIADEKGETRVEEMGTALSEEARLRMNNLATKFWQFVQGDNDALKRSVAASWSAEVFRRNPGARSVSIRLDVYALPSMAEYRNGLRPQWKTLYRAQFEKGKRDVKDG